MHSGIPHVTAGEHKIGLASGLVCMALFWLLLGLPSHASAEGFDLGLIDAPQLQEEKEKWVILDGRPRKQWQAGHLPGALPFSWEDYTRTDHRGVPYRILQPQELARALGEMGIDEQAAIVLYGDADTSWGGEGWAAWALAWIGHQGPVRLLNGGIQAWQRAGLPLEEGAAPSSPPATYRSAVRPELNLSAAELQRRRTQIALVDTRSGWEWFKGHLPEAIHLPWKDLLTGDDLRPITGEAYRRLLADKGVPADRPVVFYCTGGIRSGYAWTIHQLYGARPAANFEGGTEAWERLAEQ